MVTSSQSDSRRVYELLASWVWASTPMWPPPARPTHGALLYASRRPGVPPRADIYLPRRAAPSGRLRPGVLLVHGGGFTVGSRRMRTMRLMATRLLERGFAVCSIDYRLIFRGGGLDAALEDVAVALRWWAGNARRWRLDTSRLSAIGASAGATLLLLAAAERSVPRLHRLICAFGLYDFASVDRSGQLLMRLLLGTADRERWRALSPLERAGARVPTMLVHGEADAVVPAAQAKWLARRRAALGLATRVAFYPGQPHGFFNRTSPVTDRALRDILAFLGEDKP